MPESIYIPAATRGAFLSIDFVPFVRPPVLEKHKSRLIEVEAFMEEVVDSMVHPPRIPTSLSLTLRDFFFVCFCSCIIFYSAFHYLMLLFTRKSIYKKK